MPCSDGGYTAEQQDKINAKERKAEREKRMIAAMLCAICTALESSGKPGMKGINRLPKILDKVDWEEAGVKRTEFAVWWDRHKEEDRIRRDAEAAQKKQAQDEDRQKAAALAKLTPRERALLGL